MRLRTTSIADSDVVESALWLDRQQPGLGDDFVASVQATFAEITRLPLACPAPVMQGIQFKSPLRWHAVGRFPHLAIFTVTGEEVLVVAVVHGHRDLEAILRSRAGVQ